MGGWTPLLGHDLTVAAAIHHDDGCGVPLLLFAEIRREPISDIKWLWLPLWLLCQGVTRLT